MMQVNVFDRITIEPNKCDGKRVFVACALPCATC